MMNRTEYLEFKMENNSSFLSDVLANFHGHR